MPGASVQRDESVCELETDKATAEVPAPAAGVLHHAAKEGDMGPKRCLLAERLQGVRRALRDSDRTRSTVTSIATGYGFYELGRFAATYKEAFGEAPSETLRR